MVATGLSTGPLAGFPAPLVDLEPEALGLSSSAKFLFSHLDGKHIAGIKLAEVEDEREKGETKNSDG